MSSEMPIFIDIDSSSSPEGTPLKPIFCVKKRENVKDIEDREECFILEFDPYDVDNSSDKLNSVKKNLDGDFESDDVSVVSEKGQVACRDYPHSRYVCVKYPFETTSHHLYCKLCYCFVCDVSAPCKKWTGTSGHCHAFDNEAWQKQRRVSRRGKTQKRPIIDKLRFVQK
ncbi:hypothetical protein Leryth_004034 [Lithospermum erythrorhizon]|nr:hypothetical protein Leryth_004034 [Lithospermum erythrorhizon]